MLVIFHIKSTIIARSDPFGFWCLALPTVAQKMETRAVTSSSSLTLFLLRIITTNEFNINLQVCFLSVFVFLCFKSYIKVWWKLMFTTSSRLSCSDPTVEKIASKFKEVASVPRAQTELSFLMQHVAPSERRSVTLRAC